MRLTDIVLAFPSMVVTLALVGIMGPGVVSIILAMAISAPYCVAGGMIMILSW